MVLIKYARSIRRTQSEGTVQGAMISSSINPLGSEMDLSIKSNRWSIYKYPLPEKSTLEVKLRGLSLHLEHEMNMKPFGLHTFTV